MSARHSIAGAALAGMFIGCAVGAQSTPGGRFQSGPVTLTLDAGRAIFVSPRGVLVDASFTVAGHEIVFRDTAGAVACPGQDGRYGWQLANDTLSFRLVSDPCEGRRGALGRPWARLSAGLALRGATLIDGTGAAPRRGMTILVRDGLIAAVQPDSVPQSRDVTVRDLAGQWLMPGLVDAHVHVATNPSGTDRRASVERRLRVALRGGVVAVRDMGGDARVLADLSRAADAGDIEAPAISYSAILAGPEFFRDPRVRASSAGVRIGGAPWARAVMDTTDLRQVMAEVKGTGARGVKLYADLDGALVARIADEARRQGLRVWSHLALMPARPSDVVRAGVHVGSHAPLLAWEKTGATPGYERRGEIDWSVRGDDPVMQRLLEDMRARGVALEPTLFAFRAGRDPQDTVAERRQALAFALTRAAHGAGVRIVAGTDGMGGEEDGALPNIHEEMRLLVEGAGLTPMEALLAATRHAAEAAGLEATHGTIAVGKAADLLVLRADPMADIGHTREIALVVRRGRIVAPR